MSSRKKTLETAPLESVRVQLKPLFGIAPRQYIPVVWALALAAILFLLFIVPGIRRNGTNMTFRVLPPDASIIVDGVRLGSSDDSLFVPRGSRRLLVRHPGFEVFEQTIDVKGRIIASRFFPRREEYNVRLEPLEGYDPIREGIDAFAAWSATGDPRDRYALPPVLTSAARNAVALGIPPSHVFADDALPLALDERHLSEILRSDYMQYTGVAPASLTALAGYVTAAAVYLDNHPSYAEGVADLTEPSILTAWGLDDLVRTPDEILDALKVRDLNGYAEPPTGISRRVVGGVNLVDFSGLSAPIGDIEVVAEGYLPRSGAIPAMAKAAPFAMALNEVTNAEFARFVSENPEWSLENRPALISRGLADDHYLSSWGLSGPQPGTDDDPVSWVSWYAAEAYGEWFTERFLTSIGSTARLPTEDEWEIAARFNKIVKNTEELPAGIKAASQADLGDLEIRGLAGNVREWCSNPFRYNENRFRNVDGVPGYASEYGYMPKEMAVRGGSYIDGSLPYPAAIRGGLPAESTSPVVGFRLVVVEK